MKIAQNKKAFHDYFIEERYEAGLVLQGWEAKAIRAGRVQLKDAYVLIRSGEIYMVGGHISALPTASTHVNPDPVRTRWNASVVTWLKLETDTLALTAISTGELITGVRRLQRATESLSLRTMARQSCPPMRIVCSPTRRLPLSTTRDSSRAAEALCALCVEDSMIAALSVAQHASLAKRTIRVLTATEVLS